MFTLIFDGLNFLLGLVGRLPTKHLLLEHVRIHVLIADVVCFLKTFLQLRLRFFIKVFNLRYFIYREDVFVANFLQESMEKG